ncbi:MAG: DUF1566 domain-containing protein [Gammaproteobacteria bacterium]
MPALTKSYLQTGQVECRDTRGRRVACAGSGQDAALGNGVAWRPEGRFHLQDGCVLDTATGLYWLRDAGYGEFPRTWQEGLDFIAQMNHEQVLGKRDWRLPNRRELRSLVSHQTSRPALPQQHPFENLFQGWYWTSTTAAISPAHAWYVDMGGGRMFYGGKDQSFMVWPVRGSTRHWLPVTGQRTCYDVNGARIDCAGSGQDGAIQAGQPWPDVRFRAGEDGIVDRLTGLCWQRGANLAEGELHWEQALAGIAALNSSGGPGNWRLPNINELETLVDCSRARPALAAAADVVASPGTVYWSSTTSMYEPDWAWALYLEKGAVGVGHKQQARFSAWAVRTAAEDTGGVL